MELQVIADYKSFAVVDKPSGILSTPGTDPEMPDMMSLFRKQFPGTISHSIVHRLDMDTSGVMVMAKNQRSHQNLSRQFADRLVQKRYEALLEGEISGEGGRIELAFSLDFKNKPLQVYDPEKGKLGITEWELLGVEQGISRVLFKPVTGRTHQLRLHASHELGLNTPIVGDTFYNRGEIRTRLMLHARDISFLNPETGELLWFTSPVPF